MAPEVKKAKTAFLYFQGDQLALVKRELDLSMGDAMTEVRTYYCFCFLISFVFHFFFNYSHNNIIIVSSSNFSLLHDGGR